MVSARDFRDDPFSPKPNEAPEREKNAPLPSDPELLKSMVREIQARQVILETENEQLRRCNQVESAKHDFLTALSHELRIPLTPVMALLSSMEHDERLPGEARADLTKMRGNLELESKVIDDLLIVNRTSGKVQLRKNTVDLHEIARRAVEIVRNRVAQKKIELWVQLSAERHQVCGDSQRLIQVIWNLLDNAIRFTPSGGDVTISSSNTGAAIHLCVIDSGSGIDPEDLDRIFAPPEQKSPPANSFGEIGLGLPMSRRLVELHGGALRAQSDGLGTGASFTVELACISSSIEQQRVWPIPQATRNGELRILLVEDDAYTASTLERLLKQRGNNVEVGHNLVEAMALAGRAKFDIVISDIGLPDGTGHDLMRYFAGHHASKGIALSGYGMDADIEQSLRAGFSEHLTKPVSFEELEAAVERVLGS